MDTSKLFLVHKVLIFKLVLCDQISLWYFLILLHFCIVEIGEPLMTGLSEGERKRATLACELLKDPTFILIDVSIYETYLTFQAE